MRPMYSWCRMKKSERGKGAIAQVSLKNVAKIYLGNVNAVSSVKILLNTLDHCMVIQLQKECSGTINSF